MSSELQSVLLGYILGLGTTLLTGFLQSRNIEIKGLKALSIEIDEVLSDLEQSTYMPISLTIWDQLKASGQYLDFDEDLKKNLLKLNSILENRKNLLRYHLSGLSPPFQWRGTLQGPRMQGMEAFFTNAELVIRGADGESTSLNDVLVEMRGECETLCANIKTQIYVKRGKYFF